jgi:hypothetical protein
MITSLRGILTLTNIIINNVIILYIYKLFKFIKNKKIYTLLI